MMVPLNKQRKVEWEWDILKINDAAFNLYLKEGSSPS